MQTAVRACVQWIVCCLTLSACAASTPIQTDVEADPEALLASRDSTPQTRVTCGGFLGTLCPGVGECVDDPADECDPQNGGADCSGVCVCAQAAPCPLGKVFNSSPEVCDCRPRKLVPIDNMCSVISCPVGTRCQVVDGKATCVRTPPLS